jgi:RNA polymerase sporulation-specific sigma factor
MDRTLELIKKVQEGDESAKEVIVEENLGLIWSVVRKFTNRGHEADDLFQIGAIGLLKCIDKFDLSFNVKFSTYAVPMIMGEIRRFLRDDGMIKVSRPLKELSKKAKYMQENLTKENGKSPTISELAAALDTDVEELVVAMESAIDVESLYATIHQGDGTPVYLIDKLDQKQGSTNSMIEKIALSEVIDNLKPKEKQIVTLRYFEDKTQTEVAKIIGVSQVQVSRIEKKVLQAMRENLT